LAEGGRLGQIYASRASDNDRFELHVAHHRAGAAATRHPPGIV